MVFTIPLEIMKYNNIERDPKSDKHIFQFIQNNNNNSSRHDIKQLELSCDNANDANLWNESFAFVYNEKAVSDSLTPFINFY